MGEKSREEESKDGQGRNFGLSEIEQGVLRQEVSKLPTEKLVGRIEQAYNIVDGVQPREDGRIEAPEKDQILSVLLAEYKERVGKNYIRKEQE